MVGAGTDVLGLPEIPGPASTFVAVRLAASPDELAPGETHVLRARILAPDGTPVTMPDGSAVQDLEVPMESNAPVQQLVPGWLVNPLFSFGMQWWARETGSYTIEFEVDGGEPYRQPVHVLEAQALQPPQP
jgi:hypothetical protein